MSKRERRVVDLRSQLDRIHPGWREIVGEQHEPTAFRIWLAAQPRDYQQSVNDSWSVSAVAAAIRKFLAEKSVH